MHDRDKRAPSRAARAGSAAAAGRQAGRPAGSSLLSWCWAVPMGAARHTPEPLRWPPPLPRV
jgi:hypothetical protein